MINRVVILGRDITGWLAAAALARALPRTLGPAGVSVTVVELPSLLHAADLCATLPAIEAFHRLIGLNEDDLLKRTRGAFTLGHSFVNFAGPRPPFFHAYGSHGVALGGVAFAQLLTRARQSGLTVPFEEFSLTAAAAKRNRFIVPDADTAAFARTDYGYHLPARAYAAVLKARAVQLGVEVVPASAAAVERNADGDVTALLAAGQRIAGELFIDAAGADSPLATGERESWADAFPANRTLTALAPRLKDLPPYAQIRAQTNGWVGLAATQDATHVSYVYDGGRTSDDEALQAAAIVTRLKLDDAVAGAHAPGRALNAWTGNVVALGDAACTFDAIENVALHAVQTGLVHLLTLFPIDGDMRLERDSYNAVMRLACDRLRDVQQAHYLLQSRDLAFWTKARAAAVPDSLAIKLDAFRARGLVPLGDEEGFHADSWHAILLGHGLVPESYEPMVDTLPDGDLIQHLKRVLGHIKTQVEAATSHDAYLEIFCT